MAEAGYAKKHRRSSHPHEQASLLTTKRRSAMNAGGMKCRSGRPPGTRIRHRRASQGQRLELDDRLSSGRLHIQFGARSARAGTGNADRKALWGRAETNSPIALGHERPTPTAVCRTAPGWRVIRLSGGTPQPCSILEDRLKLNAGQRCSRPKPSSLGHSGWRQHQT